MPRSHRKVSIGSDMDIFPVQLPQDPEEKEGILLLLGMSNIVKKEMASNTEIFEEDEPDESDRLQLDQYLSTLRKRSFAGSPSSHLDDENPFAWSRARTVSMDSPKSHSTSPKHVPSNPLSLSLPAIVTPVGPSRLRSTRRTNQRLVPHKGKKEKVKLPKLPQLHRHPQQLHQQQENEECVQERRRKAVKMSVEKGIPITTIHRKKFSWKNYPELEAFLIANREEYLRHSALNYTVQQKQYNNRLTERLLDLAADHGYVFDEEEFSFVTVRDRVRCYYKSYVQSSKKRGVVLGYAARKAGILTPAELQKSARREGTIITPPEL